MDVSPNTTARRGRTALAAAGVAALLLVGIAVAVALGAEGTEPPDSLFEAQVSTLERSGLSPAQATRGIEAQTKVDEARLVAQLEETLGDAFGGVWLEPESATLQVAVTTIAGERAAEAIAERAGLEAQVVATLVRFSWSELIAARKQWGRHHVDLLAGGKAALSLRPQSNSVKVRLSSSFGPAKRSALEQEAAAYPARFSVVATDHPSFAIEKLARCRGFEENKAHCDPTIAAGVSIRNPASERCTTGPAIVETPLGDNTTETFVLTAGHCIETIGEEWEAFSKAGVPKDLGKSVIRLNNPKDVADVGVIKVENEEFWMNGGLWPVNPAVAYWEVGESEPLPVVGEQAPVINHTTCHSGNSTGTACGRIEEVGLSIEGLEELVEVRELSKEAETGDSGGPWFSKEKLGLMVEGTMVGNLEETEFSFFHPLAFSLTQLEANGDAAYKLLTVENELRPPCPMPNMECFAADSYPATITGSQVGTTSFGTESGKVECGSSTYSGSLSEGSETFELSPSYSSCNAFGLGFATIDDNSCKYEFEATSRVEADKYKGTVDVVCPSEKSIQITSICKCTVTIGPQTALGTVEFTDTTGASPKKDVDLKLSVSGLQYTEGSECKHPGTRSNGTLGGEITIKADTEGGSAQGIWIAGG